MSGQSEGCVTPHDVFFSCARELHPGPGSEAVSVVVVLVKTYAFSCYLPPGCPKSLGFHVICPQGESREASPGRLRTLEGSLCLVRVRGV